MRPSSWVPPVVWMAVIAGFSTEWFSESHTEGAVVGLLAWVAPWLAPGEMASFHGIVRKGAHLTEYAILALLWFRALTRDTTLSRRGAFAIAFAICASWAALDEVHQTFVPGRTGSGRDVAIDAAGSLLALVCVRRDWIGTARAATSLLLWMAAAGGAVIIAVDWLTGVPSGYLWVTVPVAALLLVARRWWPAPRPVPSDPFRP